MTDESSDPSDVVARDVGEGKPVVLLHGVGSDSRVWDRVVDELADRFRLLTIDLPGVSMLRLEQSPESLGQLALAVDGAMADRQIDSYSLVGHSYGAAVCLAVAQAFPAHVGTLSLIAPGGFGPEINPALRVMSSRTGLTLLRLAHRPAMRRRVERMAARYRRSSQRGVGSVDELLDTYNRLSGREAQTSFQRSLATVFETRRTYAGTVMPAPEMPVQIMWGENDLVLPVWQIDAAAAALRTNERHIIAGAGHAPHRTHAREVAQRLSGFVLREERSP